MSARQAAAMLRMMKQEALRTALLTDDPALFPATDLVTWNEHVNKPCLFMFGQILEGRFAGGYGNERGPTQYRVSYGRGFVTGLRPEQVWIVVDRSELPRLRKLHRERKKARVSNRRSGH